MSRTSRILEGQGLHAAALAVLLGAVALARDLAGANTGALWGLASPTWFWAAVLSAVLHQVYVWFCWRTELHARWLTRAFGDLAFPVYAAGFVVVGGARVATVFALAYANRGTLPIPSALGQGLALIALVPVAYLWVSVMRYFGFRRAFGIDHFDPAYRNEPLVREGIFRLTPNAMYVFGFLLLWAPALWWSSLGACIVVAFEHVYIWVHYATTERPDMRRIYGERPAPAW